MAAMTAAQAPSGAIITRDDGAIRIVTIANEARLNALTRAMWQDLSGAMRKADTDESVRVVILTGAGQKSFSAGADISEFGTLRSGEAARAYVVINTEAFDAVARCSKPTIAMVHGYCFGGGLEIAASADLRLASQAAQFSLPPAKLGIGYNPRWLPPLIASLPAITIKEMLFTGRRYTAEQALAMGLVGHVHPAAELEQRAHELAREIAANAPLSVMAAKRAVDAFTPLPPPEVMAKLDADVAVCFASADYAEGQRAFIEKRVPKFEGR